MKQTNQNLDLARDPIGSLLYKMSTPSIAAMLVMALYNFIDIFWLSRISADAMAALTIVFSMQIVIGALGIGTGVGVASYASRMLGAGHHDLANRVGQAITLSLILGLMTIFIGLSYSIPLLKFFGAQGPVLDLARDYLVIYLIGVPLIFTVIIMTNLFRAEGKPKLAMAMTVSIGVLGMIIDPLLILGLGPFPALGVRGAALSFVISHLIIASLSYYLLLGRRSRFQLKWRYLIPDGSVIGSISQVGLPSFVMNITLSIALAVFNRVLGVYGPLAIAALGLIFRINGILAWVTFGIGQGVMPLVGFNYGAHLYSRVIEIVKRALKISTLIGLVYSLTLIVFAEPVISIFTRDASLLKIAVPALRIFMSMQMLLGPIIIWTSMFNGLGKGFTSMLFLTLRDAVFLIPFLLAFSALFGLQGVWIAQPVSNFLVFVLLFFRTAKEIKALRERN